MDYKNEKIVKEISALLLSLTGFPGDSRDKDPKSNDFGISFDFLPFAWYFFYSAY